MGWGSNLDAYFVAIAAGCLQKTGGSFTLSAETDFGASYGLKSLYYKSRSSNVADAGILRGASAESLVAWRNNANSGNLVLTTNASDQIVFNGTTLAPSASPTFTGTVTAPNILLTDTSNQMVLGTTRTVTITAPTPASTSRTWTIPDITSNGTFVALQGAQTFTGVKTFTAQTNFGANILFDYTHGVVLNDASASNTISLKAPSSVTTYSLTLPADAGTTGYALTTNGSGTTSWTNLSGAGTVSSGVAGRLTLYPATGNTVDDIYAQNAHNIDVEIAAQGSRSVDLVYTIPNPGNAVTAANILLSQGAQTIVGQQTFSASILGLAGTGVADIAFSFAGDTNSGLARIAADDIALVVNGAAYLEVTTSAITAQTALFVNNAAVTISNTTNQIVLGTTRQVTINAPTPASASRTVTLPDLSADYSVVGTVGTQTVGGTKTFSAQIIASAGMQASGTVLGDSNGARDLGSSAINWGNLYINGDVIVGSTSAIGFAASGAVSITGTKTNSAASAGKYGEVIESIISSLTNFPSTTAFGDLTSISLTAGNWMIYLNGRGNTNTSTAWTGYTVGVSTTTGNSTTGLVLGDNESNINGTANLTGAALSIPGIHVLVSATTTYYYKFSATYSNGQPQATGRITAVRIS